MGEPDEGRLEDVDRDDELPRRSSGLILLGLLGGAVLVAMVLGQLTAPDPQPRPPTAVASTTATDQPTGPAPEQANRRRVAHEVSGAAGRLDLG